MLHIIVIMIVPIIIVIINIIISFTNIYHQIIILLSPTLINPSHDTQQLNRKSMEHKKNHRTKKPLSSTHTELQPNKHLFGGLFRLYIWGAIGAIGDGRYYFCRTPLLVLLAIKTADLFCIDTVDGWNPAPLGMYKTLQTMG